jgi:3-hydroxybutyryl-CoA dehydrogenase
MNANAMKNASVLVVGAGIMGAGIAQIAAQAGHSVLLFDMRTGAAIEAHEKLDKSLQALVARGKLTAEAVAQTLSRITAISALAEAASAGLVVEAIVEKLEAKRGLFRDLEAVVSADCILATNTSSISVTAIANGLQHPGRLVGMHFFNPVPLMKLVEVVSGLQTDPKVADAIFALSEAWGKVAVHARSTPGFIVNRIARPFYAETLALLQEQAATPPVLDACLRACGFRMGPCELMDLIGHDTNFSVTQSVYEANFFDKRFQPSLVQREMVDGGLLGRKSGQGFYSYAADASKPGAAPFVAAALPDAKDICLHGTGAVADALQAALAAAMASAEAAGSGEQGGVKPATGARLPALRHATQSDWIGLEIDGAQLRLSDGRCATQLGREVSVFDLPLQAMGSRLGVAQAALAWAPSARASQAWVAQSAQWLQALGCIPQRVADTPGLVVARSVAMLVNEASDAVHQGVCTVDAANAAMKLGVNYPAGPFEWLEQWGAASVCALLDALDATYRGERYRASPALRQRSWQE